MLQFLRRFRFSNALPVVVQALGCSLIALTLTEVGYFSTVQGALSDRLTFSSRLETSGEFVLVVADRTTLNATGKFPYDRQLLAAALDRLREAGVELIYLDAALNSPEDPAGDARLATAINALGPGRLALPTNPPDAAGESALPLPPFKSGATLVATDFKIDADRRSRRIQSFVPALPSASDWLAGRARPEGQSILVDLRFDPATLPRYEMRDIAEGRVGADTLAGRKVLMGLELPSTNLNVFVPKYRRLGSLAFIALGAETARAGPGLMPTGSAASLAISVLVTLLLTPLLMQLGVWRGLAFIVSQFVIWFCNFASVQFELGLLLPPLCPPLAVGLVWLLLLLRESRLMARLRSRLAQIAGIGRSGLLAAVETIAEPACLLDQAGGVIGANNEFAAAMRWPYKQGSTADIARSVLGMAQTALAATGDPMSRAARFDLELEEMGRSVKVIFDTRVRWIDTLTGTCALATMTDVTEMRQRESKLTTLAYSDALTGLGNRLAFEKALSSIPTAADATPSALALIDLDGFKQVNDTLGHHIGDLLLIAVAAV